MKERVCKIIARRGYCSRRQAEELVLHGRVKVNGELISSPALNISQNDIIEIDSKLLTQAEKPRMWLFYKPSGVITSRSDPQGRTTIYDILPKNLPRVISIGRLDYNSEGLLLLTNCGELARKMELPDTKLVRKYRCRIFGNLNQQVIAKLKQGIEVEGFRYAPIHVTVDKEDRINKWVEVALTEGKNREIRRAFQYFDIEVSRLIRTDFGAFSLGNLKKGEVREVNEQEFTGILKN